MGSHSTTISAWGNSDGIRIPKSILRAVGLRTGDQVNVRASRTGAIEISPVGKPHRHVKPLSGVSFDSLFEGYDGPIGPFEAWPDDDFVGAEREAWFQ